MQRTRAGRQAGPSVMQNGGPGRQLRSTQKAASPPQLPPRTQQAASGTKPSMVQRLLPSGGGGGSPIPRPARGLNASYQGAGMAGAGLGSALNSSAHGLNLPGLNPPRGNYAQGLSSPRPGALASSGPLASSPSGRPGAGLSHYQPRYPPKPPAPAPPSPASLLKPSDFGAALTPKPHRPKPKPRSVARRLPSSDEEEGSEDAILIDSPPRQAAQPRRSAKRPATPPAQPPVTPKAHRRDARATSPRPAAPPSTPNAGQGNFDMQSMGGWSPAAMMQMMAASMGMMAAQQTPAMGPNLSPGINPMGPQGGRMGPMGSGMGQNPMASMPSAGHVPSHGPASASPHGASPHGASPHGASPYGGRMTDFGAGARRKAGGGPQADCPLCQTAVPNDYLLKHLCEHLAYTPFRCKVCGFLFFTREDAIFHFTSLQVHGPNLQPQVVEAIDYGKQRELQNLLAKARGQAPPPSPAPPQAPAHGLTTPVHPSRARSEASTKSDGRWRLSLEDDDVAAIPPPTTPRSASPQPLRKRPASQAASPQGRQSPAGQSRGGGGGGGQTSQMDLSVMKQEIIEAAEIGSGPPAGGQGTPRPSGPASRRGLAQGKPSPMVPRRPAPSAALPAALPKPNSITAKLTGLNSATAALTSVTADAQRELSKARRSAASPTPGARPVRVSGVTCQLCQKILARYPAANLRNHVGLAHLSAARAQCKRCDFEERLWYPTQMKPHMTKAHPEAAPEDFTDNKDLLAAELDQKMKCCFPQVKEAFSHLSRGKKAKEAKAPSLDQEIDNVLHSLEKPNKPSDDVSSFLDRLLDEVCGDVQGPADASPKPSTSSKTSTASPKSTPPKAASPTPPPESPEHRRLVEACLATQSAVLLSPMTAKAPEQEPKGAAEADKTAMETEEEPEASKTPEKASEAAVEPASSSPKSDDECEIEESGLAEECARRSPQVLLSPLPADRTPDKAPEARPEPASPHKEQPPTALDKTDEAAAEADKEAPEAEETDKAKSPEPLAAASGELSPSRVPEEVEDEVMEEPEVLGSPSPVAQDAEEPAAETPAGQTEAPAEEAMETEASETLAASEETLGEPSETLAEGAAEEPSETPDEPSEAAEETRVASPDETLAAGPDDSDGPEEEEEPASPPAQPTEEPREETAAPEVSDSDEEDEDGEETLHTSAALAALAQYTD